MKLFATSDLHGNLDGSDPIGCDLAILAGDIAPLEGLDYISQFHQIAWVREVFCDWCASFPDTTICVIPGNHDLFADEGGFNIPWPKNVRFLVDAETEVNGLRIYGTPWVPRISGCWAFEEKAPGDLRHKFEKIPDGLDILITHAPPRIPGSDIDKSLDVPKSPHYGSPDLLAAIQRIRPGLVFCGHIHSGDHTPCTVRHDGTVTIVHNVSRLNEDYEPAYEPLVMEL